MLVLLNLFLVEMENSAIEEGCCTLDFRQPFMVNEIFIA